jgi:curved DNA-binding protein CbpA
MRSEELVILDENLLHSPFGSTDPYKFYRLLNVEINASLLQIEAAYKKLSLLYHPHRHDTDKDAWTAQFQILSTIKSTLTNTEERQKYNRQSRRAAQNAERERRRAAEAPPNGEREHVQEREAAPPPPPARTRRRASNVANQANADPPPSYRASGHPATKAVMQRHMETINRLKSAGKALQQDVDNLITLFDVYDTLPRRPNGLLEGENWDAVDPMKPLGQPVGKRFVRTDYAGYIVGFDHLREGILFDSIRRWRSPSFSRSRA